ncbi:unnamed protein product [Prorocentrum cordatum]|uniref:Uncharacterized protein n=1 Tax=Prorocentrum cordatum TaxID=2364126 RepID=A0ABN9UF10_9DINO|nr:unnamed protein product [Polarella glacialis]
MDFAPGELALLLRATEDYALLHPTGGPAIARLACALAEVLANAEKRAAERLRRSPRARPARGSCAGRCGLQEMRAAALLPAGALEALLRAQRAQLAGEASVPLDERRTSAGRYFRRLIDLLT